jgi:hypothetical protein
MTPRLYVSPRVRWPADPAADVCADPFWLYCPWRRPRGCRDIFRDELPKSAHSTSQRDFFGNWCQNNYPAPPLERATTDRPGQDLGGAGREPLLDVGGLSRTRTRGIRAPVAMS